MSFQDTSEGKAVTELGSWLSYRRPAFSKGERRFIKKHLSSLGLRQDAFGNLWKIVGQDPVVMWSCHTDSVHREHGFQNIIWGRSLGGKVDVPRGNVCLWTSSKDSSCLGADDMAGVWIMAEMLRAKVPGLYIFHRAEEVGGKGSDFITAKPPAGMKLSGIRYAVAIDRRGYDSVITHQGGTRCCSAAFATEFAKRLGGAYKPDSTGSFTDTANYTDLIGECTNLSSGYFDAHSQREYVDVSFLCQLRDILSSIDFSTMPAERKPGEKEKFESTSYSYPGSYYGNNYYERTYGKSSWVAEGSETASKGTISSYTNPYTIPEGAKWDHETKCYKLSDGSFIHWGKGTDGKHKWFPGLGKDAKAKATSLLVVDAKEGKPAATLPFQPRNGDKPKEEAVPEVGEKELVKAARVRELTRWIKNYPECAATMIDDWGIGLEELQQTVFEVTGVIPDGAIETH